MNNNQTPRPSPSSYHRTLHLATPPAQTWTRLVDPALLSRWLCDTVELELHPGGRFRPGGATCVTLEPADGQVLAVVPEERLELRWPMGGVDTRVTFALSPHPSGAALEFTHTPDGVFPAELEIPALWALQLTHLHTLLEQPGRELPLRVDRSAEPSSLVWLGVSIQALPARLYGILTGARDLGRWLGSRARVDLREGGRIDFGWSGRGPTTLETLKKNRLVIHGWQDPAAGHATRVTWSIMPEKQGSRIEFLHEGIDDPVLALRYRVLWSAALVTLKDFAEHGRSLGLGWDSRTSEEG